MGKARPVSKLRVKFIVIAGFLLLLVLAGFISAKTWHLEKGQDWKALESTGEDKYLLAVAEIKQLVNTGKTEAATKALEKLKKDFPKMVGPDLDAFMRAELLFSQGKFTKAAHAYEKFVVEFPESRLYEAAVDRQFAIATAFLAGQKKSVLKVFKMKGYADGEKIMERIGDRAVGAPIGVRASLAVAESYEDRGRFNEAYLKWSQIHSRWPTGQMGRDAMLAMGRCKHAAYKGPSYDVSALISAKSYYENFRLRYPEDAQDFDINSRVEQIDEQLAYKQFRIGQYYQRTGSKQAADFYYRMVLDNWPGSTAAKMAKRNMDKENLKGEKVKNEKRKP
jgi:outer membrane protein assembly factor BamD (BamD/ComL family)